MSDLWYAVASALAAVGLVVLGFVWQRYIYLANRNNAIRNAEGILDNAREKSTLIIREAEARAKDVARQAHADVEAQLFAQRAELISLTDRFLERESGLDRRAQMLDGREKELREEFVKHAATEASLEQLRKDATALVEEWTVRLEAVARLDPEEAHRLAVEDIRRRVEGDCVEMVHHMQESAREEAKDRARKILVLAIERYAAPTVTEVTTSSIHLPGEDMKGRLIGKEGRNIKSIENETGVNLLIDDTPGMVVISTFDPLRREVARLSLERLISDGRIHPGRIEEVVRDVRADMEVLLREAGENAVHALGLQGVHRDIIPVIGRLKFRSSYSQNVLEHSLEMAHMMASMAAELGADVATAKRIGLLHDIGKALSHEVEGSHALVGAELLARHGESSEVVNAVAAHHGEVPAESIYAHLTVAADAITAARPGARTASTEQYLQRLEKLEALANAIPGVASSYAIHAGRELRVFVNPEQIDDREAAGLARHICKSIVDSRDFSGQIRVIVVRETRCIEYAR